MSHREQIIEQLAIEMSKKNIDIVVNSILQNPDNFDILFQLCFDNDETTARRAAWAIEHCFIKAPQLITPYLKTVVEQFPKIEHDSIRRHFSKILSCSNLEELADGTFIDTCFNWLLNSAIPVAVKAHCMQILFNLTSQYPELSIELMAVIEGLLPEASTGLKNKGVRLLKSLRKQTPPIH